MLGLPLIILDFLGYLRVDSSQHDSTDYYRMYSMEIESMLQ